MTVVELQVVQRADGSLEGLRTSHRITAQSLSGLWQKAGSYCRDSRWQQNTQFDTLQPIKAEYYNCPQLQLNPERQAVLWRLTLRKCMGGAIAVWHAD